MGFCQIIYVALLMISIGIDLAKHGEPRKGEYNFIISLIGAAIQFALLWGGGFFG